MKFDGIPVASNSITAEYWFYPPLQQSWNGVYRFYHAGLSVCGRNHCPLGIFNNMCWIYFISIILSSNSKKCVACKGLYKIIIFSKFLKLMTVLIWLGIWYESIVWVIMEWRGISQNAGILVALVSDSRSTLIVVISGEGAVWVQFTQMAGPRTNTMGWCTWCQNIPFHKQYHVMHAQLPWSLDRSSTYFGECYSVMTILSFSTEQLLVMQSIISYTEMAENEHCLHIGW